MDQIARFFSETGLPPHGFCLLWQPALIWLHVVSDSVIGLSYYAIPVALAVFILNRRDFVFNWIFWMFAAFILACGTTHFMDIWVLWYSDYAVQGLIKAITAIASLLTAAMLWSVLPTLLNFPTPVQLQRVTDMLETETAERRRAVEQLEQTEGTLRRLVDGIRDYGIFMLDREGYVTSWNAGAERISGFGEEEAIGTHFSRFYRVEDRLAGVPQQALQKALDGKYETEGWRIRKNGSHFWASVVIDPLYDDAGQLLGFAKITRDISDRRRTEVALEEARAALGQAQKMEALGQLTGGVAHDFNNLLAAILGSLELLERELAHLGARAHRQMSIMRHAVERGVALTSRLLAFSRKQPLAPQPTDLNKLVEGMSEMLQRTLREQVVIETVLAGELWQTSIDQGQMESCILNLAVNARDAMPQGGKLTIETDNTYLDTDYARSHSEVEAGPYVLLAVSDTGSGMSPIVKNRAFEPFFTTKAQDKGTGLGLSQVFGFVTQSGGHIHLDSEPDQGTTVKIYLPRCISAETTAEFGPEQGEPARASGGEVVLVVEDDADVRLFCVVALSQLGYRVLEAADATVALEILASGGEVNLLFTDVGLPGMDGRALAEEARRRMPRIKVLLTTAYAQHSVMHHERFDNRVKLLLKPFTIKRVAETCRAVLEEGDS